MTRRRTAARARPSPTLAACALMALALSGGFGCATRTTEDRIINRYNLDVYLQSDRKPFRRAVDHGYAHPSDISAEQLRVILGSLEIERRERARSVRAPAIPAEILPELSLALAEAFREADSSERISVMVLRKQMQKKIFDRKYLTSFVTWMEGEDLVFHLSRSDWPLDEELESGVKRQAQLPKPRPNDPQEPFRLVTNEFVRPSGKTGVAVAWRSDVFRDLSSAAVVRSAPAVGGAAGASTAGSTTTVLMESSPEALPEPEPLTSTQLESLSANDLRALADLEEARSAGRMTEAEYRRSRQAILEKAGTD